MKVSEIVKLEEIRQQETLTLIASENYASRAVREALSSCFSNKYAEGQPGKRYYQGNEFVDVLETECQDKANKLFGVAHTNVQPLSGAAANLAILWALRESNDDVQLSQDLSSGGHLSMGQEVNVSSLIMKPEHYHLTLTGEIDWEELEKKTLKFKPRIIWSGGTAYTKVFDWKKYREIADLVGAYFVADISHIGGLVAGGVHPSPGEYADVVMTTTHKSLRGPRGAMIMVTKTGLKKNPELGKKIDKGVFPGVQGGPHMEIVAALSVALDEASSSEFKEYAKAIVVNAKRLAGGLTGKGYKLIGGGTENHMVWMDLTDTGVDGWSAAWALETAGIITNRQTVLVEKVSAYYPSGLRLGTAAVTTRGMGEKEMEQVVNLIDEVILRTKEIVEKTGFTDRKMLKESLMTDTELMEIKRKTRTLAVKFPIV